MNTDAAYRADLLDRARRARHLDDTVGEASNLRDDMPPEWEDVRKLCEDVNSLLADTNPHVVPAWPVALYLNRACPAFCGEWNCPFDYGECELAAHEGRKRHTREECWRELDRQQREGRVMELPTASPAPPGNGEREATNGGQ